jgi:SAM-dependent methyltransferase
VTCRIAAHHFVDVHAFVRETVRVLKPGGSLLLADTTVPDGDEEAAHWQNAIELLRDPSHMCNYTPLEWQAMLREAGLMVQAATSSGGGIDIPVSDWLKKAGADEARAALVHAALASAPPSARRAFNIGVAHDGETCFAWQRVAIQALKK